MFFLFFSLNFAGGYREVEIPSPIPNLEVKHFIADNTAGYPGGNVGRCQLLSFFTKAFSTQICWWLKRSGNTQPHSEPGSQALHRR